MLHEIIAGVCLLCLAMFCKGEVLSFCLGFLVLVGYLLSFMACEPPGCGRDPKPFRGNKW